MLVEDKQVTDAINCLLETDIVCSVRYETRIHESIGPFKAWFISIKQELKKNRHVCEMLEFIYVKGYHTIYNDDIYWRISIV
jgi:hypothetical protein